MSPRIALLAAAAAFALAGPALAPHAMAQDAACAAPTQPTLPDPAAATLPQMQEAAAAVKGFVAASDAYQDCEIKALAAQRAEAKAAKAKFDGAVAKAADARINANQAQKEDIAKAWSAALKTYKAAHPS